MTVSILLTHKTIKFFWSQVIVTKSCWNWIGYKEGNYGRYGHVLAHRFSYEMLEGHIPEGLHIDHICRNTFCVNPAHLRIVTPKQNSLENSLSLQAINSRKTHCIRGHPLSGNNLYINKGSRTCRTCDRMRGKEYTKRKKEVMTRGC